VALSASVVTGLQRLLGPGGVVLTPEGRLTYESDMLTLYKGIPDVVVLPTSTAEVQAVVRICREARVPVVLKGVVTAEDAETAVEHGAAAVVVSNHGGGQLDGAPATLDALPEVADAIGGRVEVYLDGGIRRGTDVAKALALGARAVLAGRAPVYGLAVAGEDGVRHVLELLRDELTLALCLLGCTSPEELTRAHVQGAAV